jgi:SNF2 family DNA or RNA helicase
MKRGLYEFQKDAVETIVTSLTSATLPSASGVPFEPRAFLLGDEMGLGKTLTALEAVKKLDRWPVLIVVPAQCSSNWKKEAESVGLGGKVTLCSYEIVQNAYKQYMDNYKDIGGLTDEELIRLCRIYGKSVTAADRRELLDRTASISIKKPRKGPRSTIIRTKWGCVIMDEIHKIRNPQGSTTKAVAFLDAQYRLGLTGTPIVNAGQDLYSIWKYGLGLFQLNWDVLNHNPSSEYCRLVISVISLSREKKDITELSGLLPKRRFLDEDMVLPWDDPEQKMAYIEQKLISLRLYRDFCSVQRISGETGKDFNARRMHYQQSFLARIQRLRQICLHKDLPCIYDDVPIQKSSWTPATHRACSGYVKAQVLSVLSCVRRLPPNVRTHIVKCFVEAPDVIVPSSKMTTVYDHLRQYPEEKLVAFSTYRRFLEQLMGPWLTQIGVPWLIFSGGNHKEQDKVLQAFQELPEYRVLLVVKSAGSEGINLTMAGISIIMDPHFNKALDSQAINRIDRIGQTRPEIIVRKLYMDGSVDMAMKMLQDDKQTNIASWKEGGDASKRAVKAQGLFLEQRDRV